MDDEKKNWRYGFVMSFFAGLIVLFAVGLNNSWFTGIGMALAAFLAGIILFSLLR